MAATIVPIRPTPMMQSRCRNCWSHGSTVPEGEAIQPPGCACHPPNYKEIYAWGSEQVPPPWKRG